jgi:hypothetical protein
MAASRPMGAVGAVAIAAVRHPFATASALLA